MGQGLRNIVSLVAFQIVWFALAIGAANGSAWPGMALALGAVALHVATAIERFRAGAMIVACGLVGLAAETCLLHLGLVRYASPGWSEGAPPAWLIMLWLAFATTLPALRSGLGDTYRAKAAALGAIFGPLSYAAAARIGTLTFSGPVWRGWLAVGLLWAICLPVLLALTPKSGPPRAAVD